MAYAGSKAIGVNPNCDDMVAAVELAVYLGSAEAQRAHYELRNVIPCNTELLGEEEAMAGDPLVMAQNNTFNYTSILQPFVSRDEQLLDSGGEYGKRNPQWQRDT